MAACRRKKALAFRDAAFRGVSGASGASGTSGRHRGERADELVLLAVNIDYPDEDIEIATLAKLREALLPVRARVEMLLRSADEGKILRDEDSKNIYRMMREKAICDLSYNVDPSGQLGEYKYFSKFVNDLNASPASYSASIMKVLNKSYQKMMDQLGGD